MKIENSNWQNEELISTLRGVLGAEAAKFNGFADLDKVRPYVEKYMEEVSERRKGRA